MIAEDREVTVYYKSSIGFFSVQFRSLREDRSSCEGIEPILRVDFRDGEMVYSEVIEAANGMG